MTMVVVVGDVIGIVLLLLLLLLFETESFNIGHNLFNALLSDLLPHLKWGFELERG